MTHPEELLTGYVDGTLPPRERAVVEAHVAGCVRCGREIGLATTARSALRSVPEVPAPSDIGSLAIREAKGQAAPGASAAPRWYRVGGIVGAVAAGLLVFTLVLPHVGRNGSSDDEQRALSAAAGDTEVGKLSAASGIELQHTNYDNSSLTALVSSYATADVSAGGGAAAGAEVAPGPSSAGSQVQIGKALGCIVRSAPDETGDIQRLIRARFEGTPAYLAVFTEGPGAGQPADTVTVWVFAIDDCRILSFSSGQL